MQIALGAVYAWSVFRVPLAKQFGWSISEVTLTFTISIFVLGFAAFFGGLWLNRKGPRVVALTGGTRYGLGVFLASFSHNLWWLYLSYGVIGGIGLGRISDRHGRNRIIYAESTPMGGSLRVGPDGEPNFAPRRP